jgi:hypothetical protein
VGNLEILLAILIYFGFAELICCKQYFFAGGELFRYFQQFFNLTRLLGKGEMKWV